MSYLHKQPQRLYINIEDGGRRYQQFEKPWPELDLTITEEKVHDFISNSEVKKKSSHDSTDENKKSMLYSLAPLQKSPVLAALTPQ